VIYILDYEYEGHRSFPAAQTQLVSFQTVHPPLKRHELFRALIFTVIERGRSIPRLDTLLIVSEHLGVAVSELLEGLKH